MGGVVWKSWCWSALPHRKGLLHNFIETAADTKTHSCDIIQMEQGLRAATADVGQECVDTLLPVLEFICKQRPKVRRGSLYAVEAQTIQILRQVCCKTKEANDTDKVSVIPRFDFIIDLACQIWEGMSEWSEHRQWSRSVLRRLQAREKFGKLSEVIDKYWNKTRESMPEWSDNAWEELVEPTAACKNMQASQETMEQLIPFCKFVIIKIAKDFPGSMQHLKVVRPLAGLVSDIRTEKPSCSNTLSCSRCAAKCKTSTPHYCLSDPQAGSELLPNQILDMPS